MALQVRRGTNAERLAVTPLAGELIFTTDTKQLYVGDGSTVGGITSIANTIDSVLADTTPQLGGTLDLNGNNITGTGNIDITGTITATGNINLGDGIGSDIVTLAGTTVIQGAIQGNFVPDADVTYTLGAAGLAWREAWISQLNVENQLTVGRINGDLVGDDSTVVFDASAGTILASALSGTATIDVEGALTGNVTGDVIGSVFADDSTVLVDGINNRVVGIIDNTLITTEEIIINNDNLDASGVTFNNITSGGNGGNFDFRTSRTSLVTPDALLPGDTSIDIASSGWDGSDYTPSAVIKLGTDKYTSSIGTGVMPGRIVFVTYNDTGTTGVENVLVFNRQGRLGINTDAPDEKLDVVGNIKASGSIQPGIYADTTARDAAHASPSNGQMIYLTATHKFQGYANGAWVDLN